MSTDSSPFISIIYDGEEFPDAYEHSQMGYDPDRVFLSEKQEENIVREGLSVEAENLQEFFSQISNVELVFRYQNGRATRKRLEAEEEEEEINEFLTAPAYSFDSGEAELDPNEEWMEWMDSVHEPVSEYGIEQIQLETSGIPYHDVERLEEGLQKKDLTVVPDIQGVAAINYSWRDDTAEIEVYSDTYLLDDIPPMRGLVDLRRDHRQRTVRYGVDHKEIFNLQEKLEDKLEEVEITQLSQRILPPEIEKHIQ